MTDRPYTLAIEGATYEGSVALIRGAQVVSERTLRADDGSAPRAGRGERLMPAIAECLEEAGIHRGREAVGAVVCGAGPGSFTSLRVAGSVAKGLAAGYGVDLYAVSSLVLAVTGAKPPLPSGEYVSVLDAMRGEYFAARISFAEQGSARAEQVRIVGKDDLDVTGLAAQGIRLVGPGQAIDARPHARGVAPILKSILAAGPVDLALWEPDYGRLAEAQVRWEATHGRPLTP